MPNATYITPVPVMGHMGKPSQTILRTYHNTRIRTGPCNIYRSMQRNPAWIASRPSSTSLCISKRRLEVIVVLSSPCPRLVLALSSPCPRFVLALSSPCPRLVLTLSSPCPRLVLALSSPFPCLSSCRRRVVAVSSPCRHRVVAVSSPCRRRAMPRSRAAHWLLLRSRRGAGAVHIISTLPFCRSFAPVDPPHLLLTRPRRRRVLALSSPCRRLVLAVSSPCPRRVVVLSSRCPWFILAMSRRAMPQSRAAHTPTHARTPFRGHFQPAFARE